MSNKAKKRKVSEEPVLQDYTVTSFSDLNPDGAGPSDTSLFDEIKNYKAEASEITFNNTGDINLWCGPYPSDSSLDSIIKPGSNTKKSKPRGLFQKRSNNKSVDDSLFDGCLKSSFTDNSMVGKVHKPLQKRVTKNMRKSLFDSDLESNTPIQNSPFKKPLLRKSKIQQKPNLFDSLLKDSQPNTPEESFQRIHTKNSNPKLSNEALSNCSLNKISPSLNVITRMKKRLTSKKNNSNIFEKDFESSQSDVSMTSQPLSLKRSSTNLRPLSLKFKTATNNCSNNSNMFDDLLDGTCNESQNENESPNNKSELVCSLDQNNGSNKNYTKSFSLGYSVDESCEPNCPLNATSNDLQNKKSLLLESCNVNEDLDTDCPKSTNSQCKEETSDANKSNENTESKEPEDHKAGDEVTENNEKIIDSIVNLCNGSFTSHFDGDTKCGETSQNKTKNEKTIDKETGYEMMLEYDETEGEEILEHDSESVQTEQKTEEGGEEALEQTTEEEEDDTLDQETEGEETLEQTTEKEETLEQTTENEETLEQETGGEKTLELETQYGVTLSTVTEDKEKNEFERVPEETNLSNEIAKENSDILHSNELFTEVTNYSFQPHSNMENSINGVSNNDKASSCDSSAKDTNINEDHFHVLSAVPHLVQSNLVESIHIKPYSLDNRTSLNCIRKMSTVEMTIDTPDASFKDMPSSTPKVKGKRVSFLDVEKPNVIDILKTNYMQVKEPSSTELNSNTNTDITFTRRKSSLRSVKSNNDSRNVNNVPAENSRYSRNRRVSFKMDDAESSNTLRQSKFNNSDKLERSKIIPTITYSSSVSLESLVYAEGSESRTYDSESVYIDIHPSRSKSTSSSNTESFNGCKTSSSSVEANSESSEKSDIFTKGSKKSANENIYVLEESGLKSKKPSINSIVTSSSVKTMEVFKITEEDHFTGDSIEILSKAACKTSGNETVEKQKDKSDFADGKEEESVRDGSSEYNTEVEEAVEVESELLYNEEEEKEIEEEQQSEEELELEEEQEPEEEHEPEQEQESEEEWESEKEDESEHEQDTEETQNSEIEYQESERHSIDSSGCADLARDNVISTHKRDENLNPIVQMTDSFKVPFKTSKPKKIRTSSLFLENPLNVPSQSQLREILQKIPVSEFKRRKRKSSQNCISREQMQQYEIEEELIRNQQRNKTLKTEKFTASSKLKRPKKWVSPKLYDYLISKLKPQYGIRSRVRAEELVIFLCEQVDCIKKKKELLCEDVDKMKIELARLNIVKTHWDFFQLVNKYFDYCFKEKIYPALPGSRNAFEFGPANVMDNIVVET